MSYEKCFGGPEPCPEFRIEASLRMTSNGEPDGMDPEPACNIYPECIYRTRRAVSCKNRDKICEGNGLPCRVCTVYKPMQRKWTRKAWMKKYGISEEEYYRRIAYP